MDELSALLTELGDYRGMVQLYEDQILRGKDMSARAELARKVARMWEEQLADPREAADAWRRVLRMKQGDAEATAGLERAKSNMLKKPEPGGEREAYAPPKLSRRRRRQPKPAPRSERRSASRRRRRRRRPRRSRRRPRRSIPWPRACARRWRPRRRSLRTWERTTCGERQPTVATRGALLPELARGGHGQRPRHAARDGARDAPRGRARPRGDGADLRARTRRPTSCCAPSEGAALDFLDSTLARPPKLSEPPAPALLDTGEHEMADDARGRRANGEFEEEVIIADDLAEMIDAEDEAAAGHRGDAARRSRPSAPSPPPIPRQS